MVKFSLLNKSKFNDFSKELFDILANNMDNIAPTGNSYEDDFSTWYEAVSEGLQKKERHIVIISFDGKLIGFFQYYVNNNGLFMMEEIQILTEYQEKKYNIFSKLFDYIFTILPTNIITVEAFANKKNIKSQQILQHLGLIIIGDNKNGNCYHFQGNFENLIKWYNN